MRASPSKPAVGAGRSLAWSGLHPWFQPIVALADGRPAGLEALARLRSPGGRLVSPRGFVPRIERAGRSAELVERVIQPALALLAEAALPAGDMLDVSVNLPLDLMLDPATPAWIAAACHDHGIAPGRVLLELTESQPVTDLPALAASLTALREVGLAVAIDDAGTDLDADLLLLGLPFSVLKLDKDLVRLALRPGTARRKAARALSTLVATATRRGMPVIAEGIEDPDDWQALRAEGITYGQGFWIARPMPPNLLPAWYETWSGRRALLA